MMDINGQRMMIATNGDNVAKRSTSVSFATMVCRKENNFLKINFVLSLNFFFAFSMDLVACSFDHLCREPTKMEIVK
jgi:hypothetical protein